MATTNLGLEQPAYLSDGQTAVNAINTNMTLIDNLVTKVICYDNVVVCYENNLVVQYL
jgi:hypothetical protein